MAEAIGLAASLAGIAGTAVTIVTKLRLFAIPFSEADEKVNSLSANVALTASILTELAKTVEELEKEMCITVDNFVVAKAICEGNFKKLQTALGEVQRG